MIHLCVLLCQLEIVSFWYLPLCAPPWFLRKGLSMVLELIDSTKLTGQQAQKTLLRLPAPTSAPEIQVFATMANFTWMLGI